jgi:uncharacterized protein YijF (DUF1287 family)
VAGCKLRGQTLAGALLRRPDGAIPRFAGLPSAGERVSRHLDVALQKNLVNIKADYAKVPNKWNIHLIPRYSADSALSSIADKRPIFDLP